MANVTDPLVVNLSGSDPQNLMEYITRQKIYDSRFWKEECFGLSVADVLEKAVTSAQCIGGLPTRFLTLVLKLLQLHPETELVQASFIEQEQFKYATALGCLYLRMTGSPVSIYESLEPLYRDKRKLRCWVAGQQWSLMHMDEFIHQLLTKNHVLGIALPRLPARKTLQEAGYLPEGPRPSGLQELLEKHGGPLEYLQYKAEVEKSPAAVALWEKRNEHKQVQPSSSKQQQSRRPHQEPITGDKTNEETEDGEMMEKKTKTKQPKKKKRKRNYDNLFKKDSNPMHLQSATSQYTTPASSTAKASVEEGSEEYWNQQRAKLGLKKLK